MLWIIYFSFLISSIFSLLQVPRVFIKQKFVGGGDDVVAKDKSGELKALLA